MPGVMLNILNALFATPHCSPKVDVISALILQMRKVKLRASLSSISSEEILVEDGRATMDSQVGPTPKLLCLIVLLPF